MEGLRSRSTVWSSVFGMLSVMLILEFWVHLLVPFLRQNLRFPFWPASAAVELFVSALLAATAAIRGSRIWWSAMFLATGTVAFLFFMLGG
jgi:hypothetical protein